jgi:hypothetical protein
MEEERALDADNIREMIKPMEAMLEQGNLSKEGLDALLHFVESLPEEEREQWMTDHKLSVLKLTFATGARSTAYYELRISRVLIPLADAGLVVEDAYGVLRDAESGRKVKTLIGELARLDWAADEFLIESYKNLRVLPLDEIKSIIKIENRRKR